MLASLLECTSSSLLLVDEFLSQILGLPNVDADDKVDGLALNLGWRA